MRADLHFSWRKGRPPGAAWPARRYGSGDHVRDADSHVHVVHPLALYRGLMTRGCPEGQPAGKQMRTAGTSQVSPRTAARRQRVYLRTANFRGVRLDLDEDVLATLALTLLRLVRNGIPRYCRTQPDSRRAGAGHEGDVHARISVDLVVSHFGEDELVLEARGVVAAAVERASVARRGSRARAGRATLKSRSRRLLHPVPAQGDGGGDGHALSSLKAAIDLRERRTAGAGHDAPELLHGRPAP